MRSLSCERRANKKPLINLEKLELSRVLLLVREMGLEPLALGYKPLGRNGLRIVSIWELAIFEKLRDFLGSGAAILGAQMGVNFPHGRIV